MTTDQLDHAFEYLISQEHNLLEVKGGEYSNEDRLSNFKDTAKKFNLKPEMVAYIYFQKHLCSIETIIKEDRNDEPGHESITGRFNDARNYLLLIWCIFVEQGRLDIGDFESLATSFKLNSVQSTDIGEKMDEL